MAWGMTALGRLFMAKKKPRTIDGAKTSLKEKENGKEKARRDGRAFVFIESGRSNRPCHYGEQEKQKAEKLEDILHNRPDHDAALNSASAGAST
jgi:hypothetical protein